ncbi:hypothetical protein LY28_03728 [Ruminiclostridium sufflavum DSM 19573]|uniref:Lipoprotein n=1 Tax=Ruminiclostridium sufflavum DSM 19573 TaxID=1121337 RepID=A0A318XFB6_9FIRM|nr:hypothetical protein [Ruminiclostridium sufflavum]PYG84248.1 hypothetical protein LY28_03728 [Ruminiclostridium sufflavum DSM 19573]
MKTCIKIFILLSLSLFLVSCGTDKLSSETDRSDAGISSQTGSETTADEKPSVTINTYYEEPASAKDKDAIILKGEINDYFVEIIIKGKVLEFEYLLLKQDSKTKELVESGLNGKYSSLENQTVVIKTELPEEIPSKKIKWKSVSGKEYEYIIRDYGAVDAKDTKKVYPLE